MKDEGVDPDTIFSRDGMPLLAWPIFTKSPDGLRAMLENGADPNVAKPYPREEGRTETNHANAMVWAAEQKDPIYLKLLLDHGGDPDTRNANNETLLFHALIKQDQWQNIMLLVERGADVNASAGMAAPLLAHYTGAGGFERAYWLLQHGADPSIDYDYGKAIKRPDSRIITGVFWHPGSPDNPEWQRKCQRWLLQHGYQRPPMPKHYREMRKNLGFPYEEQDIPLL